MSARARYCRFCGTTGTELCCTGADGEATSPNDPRRTISDDTRALYADLSLDDLRDELAHYSDEFERAGNTTKRMLALDDLRLFEALIADRRDADVERIVEALLVADALYLRGDLTETEYAARRALWADAKRLGVAERVSRALMGGGR